MNLTKLIEQAELLSGVALDPAIWIDMLNTEQAKFTEYISIPKQLSLPLTAGVTEYTLPTDLVSIITISDSNKDTVYEIGYDDFDSVGVKKINNTLITQNLDGSVTSLLLSYYKKPIDLVNGDDVPELRADFHDLLTLGTSITACIIDDEPEKAEQLNMLYMMRKSELIRVMSKYRRQSTIKKWAVVR